MKIDNSVMGICIVEIMYTNGRLTA